MALDPETTRSVANATKAVAETTGKALDMVSAIGKFSNRLVGDALAQGGGMLTDQVAHWRRMRMRSLEAKFDAACATRQLTPETMSPLTLSQTVKVLEAGSLEESDEVQQLWAELLANAVDPDSNITIKKMYVTLLSDFGPAEAALLELLGECRKYQQFPSIPYAEVSNHIAEIEKVLNEVANQRWRKFAVADRMAALSNLRRLGCVAPTFKLPPSLHGLFNQLRLEGSRHDVFGRPAQITFVDVDKFNKLITYLQEGIYTAGGALDTPLPDKATFYSPIGTVVGSVAVPELNLKLTPVGDELIDACRMVT